MALDLQTIFADPVYVPYERPPQAQTLWSAIPRGLFSFVTSSALDAKAATDNALLSILGTLPANYAYVFESLGWTITQNRAFDWTPRCNLNLQNFFRSPVNTGVALTANIGHGVAILATDSQTAGLIDTLNSERYPTFPLMSPQGASGIQTNFTAWNDDVVNATTAGTVDYWISFWQFDLEQARKYPINSPLPVQLR